jgi:hypothetical protein
MDDVAAAPERTGRKLTSCRSSSGPNLLLVGWEDDATLERPELADEWLTTVRTIRDYQYLPEDPLPFFRMPNGKIGHRAGSAREWQRRREINPNG